MQRSQGQTPQDLDNWARQQGTQYFKNLLLATVEETKERWSLGHYRADTLEVSQRLDMQALAGVDMLRQVINQIDEMKIVEATEGESE